MKRYRSSDLSRNVAEVIKEAKTNGVIIECRRSNGEVEEELTLINGRRIEYIKVVDEDGFVHRCHCVKYSKGRV